MSRLPSHPTPHECNLKKKLDELAKELSAQEDNVRPFSGHSPNMFNKGKGEISVGDSRRDSLATLHLLPVSARKARWEQLMGNGSLENSRTSLVKTRVAQLKGRQVHEPCSPRPPIVVCSSVNQAERERLERQAELAELRRIRRQPLKEVADSIDTPVTISIPSAIAEPQSADFILPPAPSPKSGVDAMTCDVGATSPSSYPSAMISKGSPKDSPLKELSPLRTVEHSFPPELPKSLVDFDTSVGTLYTSAVDDVPVDLVVRSREYYSRPKFFAGRACVADPMDAPLPRQRSVTFEPAPGTAPGDTTSEGTVESDAGSISRSTFSDACIRPSPLSSPLHSASDSDGCSDTELSQIVDTALEEAAAEATLLFHTGECKSSRSGASAYDADSDDDNDDSGGDLVCSDSETMELHVRNENGAPRCQRGQRVSLGRRSSSARSPFGHGRSSLKSGMTAAALLDGETTTPVKSVHHDSRAVDTTVSQPSKADLLISESQRRIARLAELPRLLQNERDAILQASTTLRQCSTHLCQVEPGKHESSIPKRPRFGFGNHSGSSQPQPCGPSSLPFINASRALVVACQRRQVLMEELAMLHQGFPVLTPAARGDPIRARLRLSAVRLGLKPFRNPSDPSSGGGYIVLNSGNSGKKAAISARALSSVTQYHLFAILKCRGEGRLYATEMVTLAHASDLPVGFGHPANYVDLPSNIDIAPLRPDFVISLEIYCMRTGLDSVEDTTSVSSPGYSTPASSTNRLGESKQSAILFTPSSTRSKKLRLDHSQRSSLRKHASSAFSACLSASYLVSPSRPNEKTPCTNQNKLAAFTLLSTVDIRYHDDLLLGRIRTDDDSSSFATTPSNEPFSLPLRLLRLPRSTPLTGFAGLVDAAVALEARVLTRGFLTIFEEVAGLGVWRRYWCQLRADHLRFWLYPESEQSGSSRAAPLGRIDLRHVAAPRAVPAPRRICARPNTIFMRSIRAIEPGWLSASINTADSNADSNESILFRSSPDHNWLEQRHLLCADTAQERDSWIQWFNICLNALNDWMPEHFACLAAYDARLEFSQPVSSNLSAMLMHGDCLDGSADTY